MPDQQITNSLLGEASEKHNHIFRPETSKQSIAVAFFSLSQKLFASTVRSIAFRLTAFFLSTYLHEEASPPGEDN
jgi:hypothetical protein